MKIYIVRHSFKNKGTKYLPGDIIKSPEDIKLFKCKISDGSVLVFERQDTSTIHSLTFLSQKLNLPILDNVKAYLAEVDKGIANDSSTNDVEPEPEPEQDSTENDIEAGQGSAEEEDENIEE